MRSLQNRVSRLELQREAEKRPPGLLDEPVTPPEGLESHLSTLQDLVQDMDKMQEDSRP